MNSLSALLILAAAVLAAPSVHAQQEQPTPPPPKPPLIQTPPNGTRWFVVIDQRTPGAAAASKPTPEGTPQATPQRVVVAPKRMDRVIGTNGLQQSAISYSDQHTEAFYISGDSVLQKHDNSEKIAVFGLERTDSRRGIYDALRVRAFPAVDWISLNNYKGVEALGKQDCYKFQHTTAGGIELQAWIRVEDRYPVRAQIGNTIYQFSAITDFPQEVQLPPEYQEALERIQAEARIVEALRKSSRR